MPTEYGTVEDFVALLNKAHSVGLRVMIDIVFRHTACDAPWVTEKPDWYLKDTDGKPCCIVPAWSDIVDLDFRDPGLE
jgi:glycosidase